ncbi:thiol:disulfide interchange protein [Conservatibacter flavescens]|uniref:Thiol:disulfide interchange protein n=1 Tax=Conservatibacter flavescens TaxID=28161 RepID=A0A2M8S1U8_9PAST|nr:thiol:disulfide interchange protein [Conservatibacter flavescens]PJG85105.1 thiol:disulfide interchange protein [Conservatibacter flavescens]
MRKFCLFILLLCTFSVQGETLIAQNFEKNIPHFEDGVDYFSYRVPINIENRKDKKIIIQSFFAYDCRICSQAQDVLSLYAQIHPHTIYLEKHPVATEEAKYSANVYFSLQALDRDDLADLLLFEAEKDTHSTLLNLTNLLQWGARNGIPDQQFLEFLQSEQVAKKTEEAIYLTDKYGVFTIPFVVIDGKYVLTQSTLYNDDYAFAVLDFLVDRVEQERMMSGENK